MLAGLDGTEDGRDCRGREWYDLPPRELEPEPDPKVGMTTIRKHQQSHLHA